MAQKVAEEILDLLAFLESSPTAWHAVANVETKLAGHGFKKLEEGDPWEVHPGGRYLVTRNGSSLCAFIIPRNPPKSIRVIGSHTDSPAFKLKPNAEYTKESMVMLGVEVYGAPLLTSWLNRDLGIAGRIIIESSNGNVEEKIVALDEHPVVIPQLAIHLDRLVNENGLILNKQDHLAALASLDKDSHPQTSYLLKKLQEKVPFKTLLGADLYLYPLEPPRLIGFGSQMISGYRIDSLGSVHAATTAMTNALKPHKDQIKMIIFWDHEEVGSTSSQGAGSPFLPHLIERIVLSLKMDKEAYFRLLSQSLCLSVDLTHALHPNYPEKHEPRHQCRLNKGVVLKSNAQQRYASDARSAATVAALCKKLKIPLQHYVSRGDIPAGTTIGPVTASLTGMSTVDIGCPQLSMHSCRELAACQDHIDLCRLLTAALVL